MNDNHLIYDEIGRLALAVENDKISSSVAEAFGQIMKTMPATAALAREAPTQAEHDAILDKASGMLANLQIRPFRHRQRTR